MEFVGVADYYFWQGVLNGLFEPKNANVDAIELSFPMDNETTRACLEAYKWGYCFGRELTDEEYAELTTPPKEDKITFNEPEELIEKPNPSIIGNC